MNRRLKKLGGWKRLLGLVVLVPLVGCWWYTLAPRSLGGPATYVIVSGTSMQPKYHTGDLVIVHRQPSYHLGEIVAVDIDGGHVIHRLYSGNATVGWHTKGINRITPDVWTIPNKNILGSAWVLWRGGGRRLMWLGTPTGRAGLAALLAIFVAVIPSRRRRRARAETPEKDTVVRPRWEGAVLNLVVMGLALGLVVGGLTVMDVRLAGLNGLVRLPWLETPVHPRLLGLIAVALLSVTVPAAVLLTGRQRWGWGMPTEAADESLAQAELSVAERPLAQAELSVVDRPLAETELSVVDRPLAETELSVADGANEEEDEIVFVIDEVLLEPFWVTAAVLDLCPGRYHPGRPDKEEVPA